MSDERRGPTINPEWSPTIPVPDYYTVHRPHQPKLEVADYIESQGILVPRRFDSLAEARASGSPFIARSEHPQDYEGVSGLISSFAITDIERLAGSVTLDRLGDDVDWDTFESRQGMNRTDVYFQIIGLLSGNYPQTDVENAMTRFASVPIGKYSQLFDLSSEAFANDISFSYWKLQTGENRTVIADSSLGGRYHIITRVGSVKVYVVYENGKVVFNSHSDEYQVDDIEGLIRTYDDVRSLPRFNALHCPLLEVQSHGDQHFFLQYHRTLDFTPPTHSLERDPQTDEIVAQFVRGVTPSDGITVDVTVYDARQQVLSVDSQEGYFNEHWDTLYDEVMARRRRVQIVTEEHMWERPMQFAGHTLSSKFFKPEMSIVLERAEAYRKIFSHLPSYDDIDLSSQPYQIPLHFVSDGRKAYVRYKKSVR